LLRYADEKMIIPFRKKFEEVFTSQERWCKKYLWFLLFFLIFFVISVIPAFIREGLQFPQKELLSAVGLFLFLSTGLFLLMLIHDKVKQLKNIFLKVVIFVIWGIGFLIWLFMSVIWISNIFGF